MDLSDVPWLPSAIGAAMSGLLLGLAMRAERRRRLVDDLPTCTSKGVFIGLVELKGVARCDRPLRSELTERVCVYHRWSIDEHWSKWETETSTDSNGKTRTRQVHRSGWTTVASGGDEAVFDLVDDDGSVRVVPAGAQVEPLVILDRQCGRADPLYFGKGPADEIWHSDSRRRFVESAIPVDTPLYVVGQARERRDRVAGEIARDANAPLFLISTRSEQRVSSGWWWAALAWSIVGLLTALLAAAWTGNGIESDRDRLISRLITGGGAFLSAWSLAWLWMAFNSLVELRQRVRQAWANVDVQLKRRNDLIPNLVFALEALRSHERDVQEGVAALRAQLLATRPGHAGPDPRACAPLLMAMAERYPVLRADAGFNALMRTLTTPRTASPWRARTTTPSPVSSTRAASRSPTIWWHAWPRSMPPNRCRPMVSNAQPRGDDLPAPPARTRCTHER